MNNRGIYTALVAIIVIAAIGGTFIYLRKPTIENDAEITARSVREVKMAWENTRIAMDAAAGDTMADYISTRFRNACGEGATKASLKYACTSHINQDTVKASIVTNLGNVFTKIKDETGMSGGEPGITVGPHPRAGVNDPGDALKIDAKPWLEKQVLRADNTVMADVIYNREGGASNTVSFDYYVEGQDGGCTGNTYNCDIVLYDWQVAGGRSGLVATIPESCDKVTDCGPAVGCTVGVKPKTSGGTCIDGTDATYNTGFKANFEGATFENWGYSVEDQGVIVSCCNGPTDSQLSYYYCTCSGKTRLKGIANVTCSDGTPKTGESDWVDCDPDKTYT